MQFEYDDDDHQQQIDQPDRYQVFPLQRQNLVHAQAREGPFDPHQQPDDEERLAEEPDEARNVVHDGIETLPAGDVQRHPAAEEDRGGYTRDDEQIDEFGHVEQTEMHTRILGVVTGRQLRFGFGKVERPPVHLGVAGDQINHESDHGRDVPLEDEPAVGLSGDDLGELHRIGQYDDREDRESDRKLI